MERNIHMDDDFEKFLQEKADQYKLYPSEKAWNNIQRSLQPRKKWPYAVLTIFLLLGTAVIVDYKNFNFVVQPSKVFTQNYLPTPTSLSSSTPVIASGNGIKNTNSSQNTIINTAQDINGSVLLGKKPSINGAIITVPRASILKEKEEVYSEEGTLTALETDNTIQAGKNDGTISSAKDTWTRVVTTKDQEEVKVKKVLWAGEAFKRSKLTWQISFSPTVSYRRLTSGLEDVADIFRGSPYTSEQKVTNVSNSVSHKPAIGGELGVGLTYKLTDNFLLKTGVQLNYSRYQLKAMPVKQEQATLAVISNGAVSDSLNVPSTLLNYSGRGSSWFNNEYFQISVPVGFEWSVLGNSTFKWNVAASAQPVYNFANNLYLLSTDFKHYGQDASLIRKWNLNAGVETFVSYNMGSFKWQAGPQLRYQLLSSYKAQYPIKEYLVDFGFKIGVTKTIR